MRAESWTNDQQQQVASNISKEISWGEKTNWFWVNKWDQSLIFCFHSLCTYFVLFFSLGGITDQSSLSLLGAYHFPSFLLSDSM